MFTTSRRARLAGAATAAFLTAGLVLSQVPASGTTMRSTEKPVKGTVGLQGVACTSATNCYAVGDLQQPGTIRGAIVTITSGKPGKPRLVAGANELNAIACTSATNCYAVGFNEQADGVVVHFVGSTQTAIAVASVNSFTGVACVSATLCFAVGTIHNKKGTKIATISHGKVTHLATASKLATPFGIACRSVTNCYAAGVSVAVISGFGTVVTISHGLPTKTKVSKFNSFSGIACPKTTTCYAETSDIHGGLVTVKNGVPGAIHKVTNSDELAAAACVSATTCLAVGGYFSGHSNGVLVKVTNGNPGNATHAGGPASFDAVSCAPGGECVAVGNNADLTEGYLVTTKI